MQEKFARDLGLDLQSVSEAIEYNVGLLCSIGKKTQCSANGPDAYLIIII